MSRHRERGFAVAAAVAAGLILLALVAAFVWWVAGDAETEAPCAACVAAEAGDLVGVRAALAARTDLDERREEDVGVLHEPPQRRRQEVSQPPGARAVGHGIPRLRVLPPRAAQGNVSQDLHRVPRPPKLVKGGRRLGFAVSRRRMEGCTAPGFRRRCAAV